MKEIREITSVHNPQVQMLRELQKARARRENGLFLAESVKMVREAIDLGLCRTLIVDGKRREEYAELIDAADCGVLLVTPSIMQALSEAKTPQGVMCTVEIPVQPEAVAGNLIVAMDGVQDPGNVGTILRTADAAGFDGALLSGACADLYGAKTLRATMGSVFRVPVRRVENLCQELETMKAQGYAVVATELGGEDFYTHCPHEKAILVIGSEGRGVSEAVRAAATHHLALPMRGGAESLNAAVAAGIMIYEMARNTQKV
ncbi:MAG: RNA methyltransferase [Clostridia bacterium]|nr:RNA methyltransferase [Clostridia bacterium]